tara:strand:+ start:324 stop:1547 length:1224 start_codon:yes stop_codon:yes gene_type:complete
MKEDSNQKVKNQIALPVKGIKLASISSGIRYKNRDDLVLIKIADNSNVVGVFTKNVFCAAPVLISKNHLKKSKIRYLLINSGNANAGTGELGINMGMKVCSLVAKETGCSVEEVLPFSTGVIGEDLPINPFENSIPELVKNLKEEGWEKAASAIMTTDKKPKYCSTKVRLSKGEITITGICKGSGMISPDMATMLAFIATDALVESKILKNYLYRAVAPSFNSITVDGDCSTNDSCLLIASGTSGIKIDKNTTDEEKFQEALCKLSMDLARAIVSDGEGATKFVEIKISGAKTLKDAYDVGFAIANSPLVKTAIFASDPNWGRIIAAIGKTSIDNLNINKLKISFDDIPVFKNGRRDERYLEENGKNVFMKDNFNIFIDLGLGQMEASIFTCDLSHEYVKINAEYRS